MPNVLITGAGRRAGIAAACALTLARDGWDVGISCWRLYDRETGPASADREPLDLVEELRNLGIRAELAEADLTDPAAPSTPLRRAGRPPGALHSARCHPLPRHRTPPSRNLRGGI